jgi:hypothetical protein
MQEVKPRKSIIHLLATSIQSWFIVHIYICGEILRNVRFLSWKIMIKIYEENTALQHRKEYFKIFLPFQDLLCIKVHVFVLILNF